MIGTSGCLERLLHFCEHLLQLKNCVLGVLDTFFRQESVLDPRKMCANLLVHTQRPKCQSVQRFDHQCVV